ncbi:MAG: hypothetical protein LRS48_06495 [Desulfurococcales archaeon]|nr:hypothetical protein [Desulfurococcales archaeon]
MYSHSSPFYASHLTPCMWSAKNSTEENGLATIKGVAENSNPGEGRILASGHRITIKNTWTAETSNGTLERQACNPHKSTETPVSVAKAMKRGGRGSRAPRIQGPNPGTRG